MRNAIVLLIGLLVGAFAGGMMINTLRQRDAFARGVMDVLQHHYGGLREDIHAQRCDATKSTHAFAQLRALAEDIEPAIYPDSTAEAPFREFTQRLTEALDAVPNPAPADCTQLLPLVQKIGKVCDDCHQQFR